MLTSNNKIQVNLTEFLKRFIFFRDKNITEEDLQRVYDEAGAFISTRLNTINLKKELQINGVYLACAHGLFLEIEPNILGKSVSSTNQGTEGASFQADPIKTWSDAYLSLTVYGKRLLAILGTIQPPISEKRLNLYPYYNTFINSL